MKALFWFVWAMILIVGSIIRDYIDPSFHYIFGFIVGTVALTVLHVKDIYY